MQFGAGTLELETDTLRALIRSCKVTIGHVLVENGYHFRVGFEAPMVLAKEPFPFDAR